MNVLKKIAALVGILSLASLSHAATPPASVANVTTQFEIGVSTPSATTLLLATGSGNFTVYFDSGSAGDVATFFDSGTVVGTYTTDSEGNATAPKLGSVYFTTAKTPTVMTSRRFFNGLKAVTKGTVDNLIIRVDK